MSHDGLRRTFLTYVERNLPGREDIVADRAMTLDFEGARPLVRMLAAAKTLGARDALRKLAGSHSPHLRCEAVALLAQSPEQLKEELEKLAESPEPDVRVAALRALASHQCKPAGPLLVRKIQDASFHRLSIEERREVLEALFQLHPVRAEQICVEIVGKHGVLSTDEPLDQSRTIAAELLGRETRSMEALGAVIAAGKRRPWNGQALRDRATAAAEAIAARMGRRLDESGDVV